MLRAGVLAVCLLGGAGLVGCVDDQREDVRDAREEVREERQDLRQERTDDGMGGAGFEQREDLIEDRQDLQGAQEELLQQQNQLEVEQEKDPIDPDATY